MTKYLLLLTICLSAQAQQKQVIPSDAEIGQMTAKNLAASDAAYNTWYAKQRARKAADKKTIMDGQVKAKQKQPKNKSKQPSAQ